MGKQLGFFHEDLERYHGFVVKGTVHTQIKVIGRKMTFWRFSVSKCGDAF